VHVSVIIPALNEEASIGRVVARMDLAMQDLELRSHCIWVADNGSTDETATRARAAGAQVVPALRRGYGSACLAALDQISDQTDIVLFIDGDGSDDPGDVAAILAPILKGEAQLVIGSRVLGARKGWLEKGALGFPQRFGNRLATGLLLFGFQARFTDLGPFRAITAEALDALAMDDLDFGWTVQMQVRAATKGLSFQEVPVRYHRRRTGRSKISGNLKGSIMAGWVILRTLGREADLPKKFKRWGWGREAR
jgi:glycosyltransferase involved in cell wall biosynthesis